jgi:alpha-amylase/alpha-mannosidase (GH57 family)
VNKFVCIHGHFYQPPRENPWLEEVELQESARPYHDWNERVSAECYARNGASRILNSQAFITEIVNNYSKISFNIGPTLLSWMEKKDPDAYKAILEADRLGQERFSGHGPAMAQVYNHMIMPLANSRDKRTQVIWGIRDFESRYKRKPEGMWLAETAVDLESLDIMAEMGIKFTVLAPHQAKRAKKITSKRSWTPEDEESIDLRRPYLCRLPSGRTIAIFFYDGPISQAIAFEGLLHNGESFANRLLQAFDKKSTHNQMVHVATDGESYGHHHKFGDMALAYCLKHIEQGGVAKLTVYGEYLEKNSPEYEVEIVEKSSWSCVHGIERWRDNCGCNSGGRPGWHQEWRGPLRKALDWLRDHAALLYERELFGYVPDVWKLRDEYIEVVLIRSREKMESFLAEKVRPGLPFEEKNKLLRLMEIQRNVQLMYTSCGWFFDDISGIETV